MPASLPRRGDQHVGIAGIDYHVGDTGALARREHRVPALAAVGGLVQSAVAAIGPERTLRRDVYHIAVARIDHDSRDVLRLLNPHLLPGATGVVGSIDAVAIRDAALRIVFAGADPDRRGVLRVQHHCTDGERTLSVKDRCPGGATVLGFPDATGRCTDVHDPRVARVDGEARDPAADHRRPDKARVEYSGNRAVEAALR